MVHGSTLAGSRVLHQVTLSVHFSTLAGSRVIHQFSHRSTFLHLLGPELYTSFLTGPLFYTCWVHDSTLGFFFHCWTMVLHLLGPELYTRFLIGPLFYTCWVQNSTLAFSLVHFSTLAGSRIIHQMSNSIVGTQCRSMDPASVEVWTIHHSYSYVGYLV